MKALNILGLTILFAGSLAITGFGLYEFFQDSTIPIVVRLGIVSIILGIIIILISLVNERLKEN